MNKNIFSNIILLLFTTVLFSQDFSVGLFGGVNYNSIGTLYHIGEYGGANVVPKDDYYYDSNKELGSQFGVFFKIKFNNIYIQPEFSYASLKNNYPLAFKTSYWKSTEYNFPIFFGYNFKNILSFYIGPSFSFISDTTLDGVEYPITYKNTSTYLGAGLNFSFRFIALDIRYLYGLNTVEKQRVDIVRAIYGTNVAYLQEYNPSRIVLNAYITIFDTSARKRKKLSNSKWRRKCNGL